MEGQTGEIKVDGISRRQAGAGRHISSMGGTDPNHQLNSLGNGNILQVRRCWLLWRLPTADKG